MLHLMLILTLWYKFIVFTLFIQRVLPFKNKYPSGIGELRAQSAVRAEAGRDLL